MLSFWGLVLLIGIVNRIVALVASRTLSRGSADPEAPCPTSKHGAVGPVRTWIKRHIILPVTFGYTHQRPLGWCTIPTRLQTALVFLFIAINVIFCAVAYIAFPGNMYWDGVSAQVWRYFSDRTGVIALANFPLIWLFASRNNVFLWLNGWSYSTFSVFHRWIARVAILEAILHSVG